MLETLHPLNDLATALVDACYARGWDRMAQWVADAYLVLPAERWIWAGAFAIGFTMLAKSLRIPALPPSRLL